MTDYMRQVRTGEQLRIKAMTFNEFLLAAARARGTLFRAGAGPVTNPNDPGMVLLYNESGADVDFGHVLGIDSVQGMVLPSGQTGDAAADRVINLERRIVCGVTPTADHLGRWALVLEGTPTEEGGVPSAILPDRTAGVGILSGVWPAIINVVDQNHRCAEVDPGAEDPTILSSAASGSAQIVWKESTGTGERWAGLRFPFRGSTDEVFAGCCMIDQETPDSPAPNETDMENIPAGGSDEERILLKAAAPFGLPRNVKEFALFIESQTINYNRTHLGTTLSMTTPGLEFRPITEDFDFEGVDCATWNTKPATSETGKVVCGPLGEFTAYAIADESGDIGAVKCWGGYGFRWPWEQGAGGNTLTCYGIEIRAVDVDIVGGTGRDLTSIDGIRESADDLGRMIFY